MTKTTCLRSKVAWLMELVDNRLQFEIETELFLCLNKLHSLGHQEKAIKLEWLADTRNLP